MSLTQIESAPCLLFRNVLSQLTHVVTSCGQYSVTICIRHISVQTKLCIFYNSCSGKARLQPQLMRNARAKFCKWLLPVASEWALTSQNWSGRNSEEWGNVAPIRAELGVTVIISVIWWTLASIGSMITTSLCLSLVVSRTS